MMKYAVHLPNFGAYGDALVLADLAKQAEEVGWDGFFIWDHLLFAEPDKSPHVDPWIVLTAIAMQTERIKIGTMVTPLPRRRPWKLARETVSLQNLSGGRLILGVGLGDPAEWEYRSFHEEDDPRIRAQKLDESLTILTNLWTGEPFSFQGEHYELEEVTFLPAPVQPIPIWVGGYWPRKAPFRCAARYDRTMPGLLEGPMTPEDLAEIKQYIQHYRTENTPFDLAVGGITSADGSGANLEAFVATGATWWIEDISPLRLSMGWDELWKPWDTDALVARILAGPPNRLT